MAYPIIGADFCNQFARVNGPAQKLIVLDSGDCIPIEQKLRGCKTSQLLLFEDFKYPKGIPRPSLLVCAV